MDFTYFVALFLSAIVGFLFAIGFIVMRRKSRRKLLLAIVIASMLIDFVLLLDWSRAGEMSATFLLIDFAFFAFYSLFGAVIGGGPVLVMHRLLVKAKSPPSTKKD